MDGTDGAERIQLYHRSGAYIEVGYAGTRMVSRGQLHDWAKGTRTLITTGSKTEVVHGASVADYKKGLSVTVRGAVVEDFKGKHTRTVKGNVILDILDGSRTVSVAGLDKRRAGSVSDISLGGRSVATMGSHDELITGSRLITVGNKDFLAGQKIGYGVKVAMGDMEFSSVTGDVRLKTVAGGLSIDKLGRIKLGTSVADLLALFDSLIDALNSTMVATLMGPQPLSGIPQFTVVKALLATIKGA